MTKPTLLPALALVSVVLAAPVASAQQRPAADAQPRRSATTPAATAASRAELQAVNDSMTAALGRGDLRGVARFYTDDAIVDGERGVSVRGREAIDRYWLSIRGAKSWKLEVLDVGGTRDNPYQFGRSTLVTAGPDGDRTSVVEFLALWRRDAGGGLRLAVDYYRH